MPGVTQQKLGNSAFIDTVEDDLYVAVVSAYDVHVNRNGRATLLWVTRISCPSKGFWLPNALPSMLVMAGPCIGRETDKPVWVNANDQFKPQVRIGDPQVVEYLETNRPVVVNVGKSP